MVQEPPLILKSLKNEDILYMCQKVVLIKRSVGYSQVPFKRGGPNKRGRAHIPLPLTRGRAHEKKIFLKGVGENS